MYNIMKVIFSCNINEIRNALSECTTLQRMTTASVSKLVAENAISMRL